MAYYLDINPSNQAGNQYVTIPTFDITGDFTVEIDCEIYNTTGTSADGFVFSGGTTVGGSELYRDGVAQNYRAVFWRNGVSFPVSTTNIWPYASGSTANPRKVILQRIGASMTSSFDGVSGSSLPFISADNLRITTIGARQGGTFTLGMRLYRMRLYQGATLVRDYDPSNTSSDVTLIDAVGGQNGTFQNPPGGNAQWVFYSTGESLTFSGTLPKLTAAISANVAFGISASFSGSLPKLQASINANISAVTDSLSFSGTLPKLTASISATVSGAPNSLYFSGALPKLRASIDAAVSLPPPLVAFSGILPRLRMQAAMIIPMPQPAGDPLALKQALVNARRAEENRNNEYVPPVVIVPDWYIIQQRALGLKQSEANRARDEE